jgi:two-component system cell cycle response regulator DivK
MSTEPRRLLLVDDYPDALEVWALYLEGCGFTISSATTGAEALALAQTDRPDLVVLDVELPDISGLDVARRLRATAETAGMPIIAMTGRALSHEIDEAHRAGCDLVLTKPCDPARLVHEIRRALS